MALGIDLGSGSEAAYRQETVEGAVGHLEVGVGVDHPVYREQPCPEDRREAKEVATQRVMPTEVGLGH